VLQRLGRPVQRKRRSDVGDQPPLGEEPRQLLLVPLEILGAVGGEAEELEADDLDALEQDQVEGDPGDGPRRVADGHEPPTEAQRPQRRLREVPTHGVDDDVGTRRQRRLERLAQVAGAVVDQRRRSVL
jgi:hypothetical protein